MGSGSNLFIFVLCEEGVFSITALTLRRPTPLLLLAFLFGFGFGFVCFFVLLF